MAVRTNPVKNCATCGAEFVFQKDTKKMFCSRECWKKNVSLTSPCTTFKKGQHPHNFKGVIRKCQDCEVEISNFYSLRCKSCSMKIKWADGDYKFPKGKEHPLWKGGNVREKKLLRKRFQIDIAPLVLKRDNYTCQICGNRGVPLQVDHIQSWSEYVELRFSMDNCRTLCEDCHYQITFDRPKPKEVKTWGRNLRQLEREWVAK